MMDKIFNNQLRKKNRSHKNLICHTVWDVIQRLNFILKSNLDLTLLRIWWKKGSNKQYK